MKAWDELKLARKDIGRSLRILREDTSSATSSLAKRNLSLALRLQGKILAANPTLRTPKQMKLAL
jgi:hypothetical protein